MRQRYFEPVKKEMRKQCGNYIIPQRSTNKSAGYDLFSPIGALIAPKESTLIWTNIKAFMQDDEVLQIYIRSSVGIKRGLILTNQVGIIDCDYFSNPSNDGNIGLCLYNTTNDYVEIEPGEKLAQGIFMKYLMTDNCNTNNERIGGIGSTT